MATEPERKPSELDKKRKHPLAKCEGCPFYVNAYVPSELPEGYNLVFLGMAPAWVEVQEGRPFRGPSGNILRSTKDQIKLPEDMIAAYVNVTSCLAPGNVIVPEAAAACSERLMSELGNRPVVALGNEALQALGQEPAITKIAGRIIETQDRRILPTFHPAYLLRYSNPFFDFVNHLKSINRMWEEVPSEFQERNTLVVDDKEVALEVIALLNESKELSIDIETGDIDLRSKILSVSISWDMHNSVTFPHDKDYLEQHGSSYNPILQDPEVRAKFKELLENKRIEWTAHNGSFDVYFLVREGFNIKLGFDTLLANYALDERAGAQGLKKLAQNRVGAPDWEGHLKEYLPNKQTPYTEIPPEVLFPYAGTDAVYTSELKGILRQELSEDPGPQRIFDTILIPLEEVFINTTKEGARVHKERLARALEDLPAEQAKLQQAICNFVGSEWFNPNSPQQLKELIYEKLKLLPLDEKDMPSDRMPKTTQKEELERMQKHYQNEVLGEIIRYKTLQKIISTYLLNIAGNLDGEMIHPDFKLFGTVIGRISANRINPLVIPREGRGGDYKALKDLIIAREGNSLVAYDYKAMELRLTQVLTKCKWLYDVLSDRTRDLHSEMAIEMYGNEFKTADKQKKSELRVASKMVVFGVGYDRQAPSLAAQLTFTWKRRVAASEAQKLIDTFYSTMPEVLRYKDELLELAWENGEVENPYGRKRRFGLLQDKHEIRKLAFQFMVSSTANDTNLLVYKSIYDSTFKDGVIPLWPIHDSGVFDWPKSQLSRLKGLGRFLQTYPQELLKQYCGIETTLPFHYDLKVGDTWGSVDKTAEDDE